MKLDRSLNLVIPVERSDGVKIYVHSAPVSRETFDQFFMVIAKAFAMIYSQGFNMVSGPRIALKLMKKVAADMGQEQPVNDGLLADMYRLTNVLVPGDQGKYSPVPLGEAINRNILEQEDVDEVENAIAFFILASAMHKKKDAQEILAEAARLWSAQIISSNATVFCASLATLTPAAGSGTKAPPSLTPS